MTSDQASVLIALTLVSTLLKAAVFVVVASALVGA